jgi:hypothetical protein
MAQSTKPLDYVSDVVFQNDAFKQCPNGLKESSNRFVADWILVNPKLREKLQNPMLDTERKQGLIEARLDDLDDNAVFQAELARQIERYDQQKEQYKNIIENADVNVDEDIRIGDDNVSPNERFTEKNIVRGGKYTSKGSFRLGDNYK